MIVLTMKKIKQEINIDKFRARRGSALMMVVILFLITSILGVAVLAIAATERNQIIAEEKLDQAYYNARAVVQAAADWIEARHNDPDLDLVVPPRGAGHRTINHKLNGDDYTLRIWRDDNDADLIHIDAKAFHDGLPGRAALELRASSGGPSLFEYAIFSQDPFEVSGKANNVDGGVATGSNVDIPSKLNNSPYKRDTNIKYTLEKIQPPENVNFHSRNHLYNGGYLNDLSYLDVKYPDLNLEGNVRIKNPRDVHIQINKLSINKHTTLTPDENNGGRIFIYADCIEVKQNRKLNIEGNDTKPVVYLICSGTGEMVLSGDEKSAMNVFIYAPYMDIEYKGNVTLNGAIMANVFKCNGHTDIKHREPDFSNSPFEALNQKQSITNISGITWK
jgi:hypothetical protein